MDWAPHFLGAGHGFWCGNQNPVLKGFGLKEIEGKWLFRGKKLSGLNRPKTAAGNVYQNGVLSKLCFNHH